MEQNKITEKKYPIGGYAPGNYQCKCCTCGGGFIGDKRVVQCETCAVAEKEKFDALSPSEQEAIIKKMPQSLENGCKIILHNPNPLMEDSNVWSR